MFNEQAIELPVTKNGSLICAIFCTLAVIIAIGVRFHQIGLKPLHHDEGVNSYFLLNLADRGEYQYDPTNYHGPTLYYFALIALRVLGENDSALRFWPAIFGVLIVGMTWLLRPQLGPVGTPVAAFCLALSPGLVYFSRDFIHEMSFGCFTLGIVTGAWLYARTKSFNWLILFAVSVGLLFATKETAIITLLVMIIALFCASIWDHARKLIHENRFTPAALVSELKRDCKSVLPTLDQALAALIIFVFINITFYSSLFTHTQGVIDAIKSVSLWSQRSGTEHVKSFWYYFGILLKLELPLLIGTLIAGVFVIWRGTRFWLFVAAWTLGITLAYSIIGYKTPWLMISFLIPMAMLSGYAAERLYQLLPMISLKLLWLGVIIVALTLSWQLMWQVNFEKYDDNTNSSGYFTRLGQKWELKPYLDGQYGYVYAQTDRDINHLVQAIQTETDKLSSRNQTGIYIASPEYWPLPWYLREYKDVAYIGKLSVLPGETPSITQPIIVAQVNQKSDLAGLEGWRLIQRSFMLRPGVELILYLREEKTQQQFNGSLKLLR